ncbi:MAG TPA: hypothetical protein GYA06_11425 [Chloroflexi bacterium]|nr:hypothetical protein [Chloroflexota bacterium]
MLAITKRSLVLLAVAALALIIAAGCQPAATPSPTPDVNAIQTEVYSTVQAGMTATAESLPTATITPTLEPTATVTPTREVTPTDTSSGPTITPIISDTPSFGRVDDKGQWLYNIPDDTSSTPVFAPGEEFTVTWRVKNIGTTTWTQKYQFRYFLADPTLRLGASDILFPKEVKPQEEVDLTLTFRAPNTPGDYNTIWVLTNEEGANFLNLNFSFRVSGTAPTATSPASTTAPTEAPTEAPTAEPEPTETEPSN